MLVTTSAWSRGYAPLMQRLFLRRCGGGNMPSRRTGWAPVFRCNSTAMKSSLAGQRVAIDKVQKCLEQIIAHTDMADRVTQNPTILSQHGQDEGHINCSAPDAVVFPKNTEEVATVVRACAEEGVPVIPWGAGTSLEGHTSAERGGLTLDFTEMAEVLEVNQEDMDCRVQAGVTREGLNEYLHQTGLFFPIDPGANATLGGMASTRASGTNAVRYGTMREAVLGLTVVTPQGQVVRTGGRARKSAAGYDLTRLYVGAEGTLGVITEVQLRLWGLPEAISSATCSFPDLHSAVNAVIGIIQCGVPVARCELLDATTVGLVNAHSDLDLPAAPTLFLEFHGTGAGVAEQAELAAELCREGGAGDFQWAADPAARRRLWAARHQAYYAVLRAAKPGSKGWPTDVCVPISRLADCIVQTSKDIESRKMTAPIFGHVGDGNFHVIFTSHPEDTEDEVRQILEVNENMIGRALEMGGTCTGEHGIGLGKMHNLVQEHGPDSVQLMSNIKLAMDPQNIMNPGKMFHHR